jgi:UPF0271 protein
MDIRNAPHAMHIDLNCDIGEETREPAPAEAANHQDILTPAEEALLDSVTSVNIACGFHAGDHNTMAAITRAAASRKIAVGAHPSLPDREGFGRREMSIPPPEIYNLVLYQIGALAAFARAAGSTVSHVKPHGALYHMAEKEKAVAEAIASAVRDALPGAFVVGLAGGRLVSMASHMGLHAANEVFADRAYRPDGALQPRDRPNAVITDPDRAARRIVNLLQTGTIEAIDGTMLNLPADTVCIHGDSPRAPEFARALAKSLTDAGIVIRCLGK